MRLALAVAPCCCSLPAAARAEWTGQTLSSPHSFVERPLGDRRRATAARWRRGASRRASATAAGVGSDGATRAPGAAGFGARVGIVPATSIEPAADAPSPGCEPYGASGALLALITARQANAAVAARRALRLAPTGASGSCARSAARGRTRSRGASLAVNARGDAALAWFEDRGVRTDRVYVALRRAGKGFGKPRRLATGRIRGVAAAIGERGDVLVSWDARGIVRTRFKPRGTRRLPRHGHDPLQARLQRRHAPCDHAVRAHRAGLERAVHLRGRRARAGLLPGGHAPRGRPPLRQRAAAGDDPGARLRRPRPRDRRRRRHGGRGRDRLARRGGRARVARRRRRRRRSRRPGTTAVLSDLAAGPAGRLVAVWDGGVDDQASLVRAAVADGVGAPFGAPEEVSAAGRDSRFGHAAFVGERPVVVLAGRPRGAASRWRRPT